MDPRIWIGGAFALLLGALLWAVDHEHARANAEGVRADQAQTNLEAERVRAKQNEAVLQGRIDDAQKQGAGVAAIAHLNDGITATLATIKEIPTNATPTVQADAALPAGPAFDLLADELRATRARNPDRVPGDRAPDSAGPVPAPGRAGRAGDGRD